MFQTNTLDAHQNPFRSIPPPQQQLFAQPQTRLASGGGFGQPQQHQPRRIPFSVPQQQQQSSLFGGCMFGSGVETVPARRSLPAKAAVMSVAQRSSKQRSSGIDNAMLQQFGASGRETLSRGRRSSGGNGRRSPSSATKSSAKSSRFSSHFDGLTALLDAADEVAEPTQPNCNTETSAQDALCLAAIRKLRRGISLDAPGAAVIGVGADSEGDANGSGDGDDDEVAESESTCDSGSGSDS